MKQWGFLRETEEAARRASKEDGKVRNGLETYLKVIFPNTKDWVHDKCISGIRGSKARIRPDYRSESLNLIVEFGGIRHYTEPYQIKKDIENTKIYESLGYKVVRIPFFIQLSNKAIKTLFGVTMKEKMFDENIVSIDIDSENTPAFLCGAGIKRMKEDFKKFPEQYKVNLDYLKKQPKEDQMLIDWEYLV